MTYDPLELTSELIRCRSITPNNDGAIELLSKKLENIGFNCEIIEFTEEELATVLDAFPVAEFTIPASTYTTLEEDARAVLDELLARADDVAAWLGPVVGHVPDQRHDPATERNPENRCFGHDF